MHYFTWKLKLLLSDFAVKIYRRSFIYSKQKNCNFAIANTISVQGNICLLLNMTFNNYCLDELFVNSELQFISWDKFST